MRRKVPFYDSITSSTAKPRASAIFIFSIVRLRMVVNCSDITIICYYVFTQMSTSSYLLKYLLTIHKRTSQTSVGKYRRRFYIKPNDIVFRQIRDKKRSRCISVSSYYTYYSFKPKYLFTIQKWHILAPTTIAFQHIKLENTPFKFLQIRLHT